MSPSANGQIRGVLFDWDGTLIDSYRADSAAYLAMFREMGIPWTLDDLARHYSPNWYRVYRAAKLPRARWDQADRAWRKQYATHHPKLLPGARRVLKHLRARHQLGVVTRRRPRPRRPPVAPLPTHGSFRFERLQRRHTLPQAASRPSASCSAPNVFGSRRLRLRRRLARRSGDGPPRRSPPHRRSRSLPHRSPPPRRQARASSQLDQGSTRSPGAANARQIMTAASREQTQQARAPEAPRQPVATP